MGHSIAHEGEDRAAYVFGDHFVAQAISEDRGFVRISLNSNCQSMKVACVEGEIPTSDVFSAYQKTGGGSTGGKVEAF